MGACHECMCPNYETKREKQLQKEYQDLKDRANDNKDMNNKREITIDNQSATVLYALVRTEKIEEEEIERQDSNTSDNQSKYNVELKAVSSGGGVGYGHKRSNSNSSFKKQRTKHHISDSDLSKFQNIPIFEFKNIGGGSPSAQCYISYYNEFEEEKAPKLKYLQISHKENFFVYDGEEMRCNEKVKPFVSKGTYVSKGKYYVLPATDNDKSFRSKFQSDYIDKPLTIGAKSEFKNEIFSLTPCENKDWCFVHCESTKGTTNGYWTVKDPETNIEKKDSDDNDKFFLIESEKVQGDELLTSHQQFQFEMMPRSS
eukprot:144173_1